MPEMVDALGLVGETLDGQLEIESLVGVGDGTCVYRARHLVLEAPVALKFVTSTAREGTRPADQVFAEAVRLHYRLERKSLRVARVMSSGAFTPSTVGRAGDKVPYLVREWFEGGSLAGYLSNRRTRSLGGRPIGGVLALLTPVAEALEHAHAEGVAHLGLNPRNVLLSDEDAEISKVADFGLAVALNGEEREGRRNGWRAPLAAYLAPEQLERGSGDVGPASDVYTLALLVLEMLRDLPVHAAEATRSEVLAAAGQATRRAADPALPREARDVLAKALSREPSARYQDATSFWTELSRAAAAQPSMSQQVAVPMTGLTPGGGIPVAPGSGPAVVDDWDPDAVTAPKVTVPKRREPTPGHPVTSPTPPPATQGASGHGSSGQGAPGLPASGPPSQRRLPASGPLPLPSPPHSSPRPMLAAPPMPTGTGFTPPNGIGMASPKQMPAASPSGPSSHASSGSPPPPPRVPSTPISAGPHSPPPPRFEAQLQATIVEIPGVATPQFDALAASLKVPEGEAVSFDLTPAPVLPMAPWPPNNPRLRIQPETTVRIFRPSAVREVLVAGASFLVVSAIGFGLVFFFGDTLHLTHRGANDPPTQDAPTVAPQNPSLNPAQGQSQGQGASRRP